LALSHVVLTNWGVAHPILSMQEAKVYALKALELDEGLSEAYLALGWMKIILEKDWNCAEGFFRRAIELNPSDPLAYHWYAYFMMPHRSISESLVVNARALALDPFSIPINSIRGWLLYLSGAYDAAATQCIATIELEPTHPGPHAYLGMVYEQLGQIANATREMETAVELSGKMPIIYSLLAHTYGLAHREAEAKDIAARLELTSQTQYVCAYYMAVMYAGLRSYEKSAWWLERSFGDGDPWTLFAMMDPRFSVFRSDRRFSAFWPIPHVSGPGLGGGTFPPSNAS
jgi:tetratricopeptide (TPR) repeat protein